MQTHIFHKHLLGPLGLLNQYAPDLQNLFPQARCFHAANFFSPPGFIMKFVYPAPVAILYALLVNFPAPIITFKIFIVGVAVLLGGWLAIAMKKNGSGIIAASGFAIFAVVFSYPLAFEYRQSNMEMVLFVLLAAAMYCYLSGHETSAAILIGTVAAMKYYPIIYLGLFLSRKKVRPIFIGLATMIVVSLGALMAETPSIATSWKGTQDGLSFFKNTYILAHRPVESPYDHSLFGLIKSLLHRSWGSNPGSAKAFAVYMVAIALIGTVLYFARIRKLPDVNQILCLAIAAILLPPVSYDYTLLHLYVPFALLVMAGYRAPHGKPILCAMALFAILFAYQTEPIRGLLIGGQIKCVALILLMALALVTPFTSSSGSSNESATGQPQRAWEKSI